VSSQQTATAKEGVKGKTLLITNELISIYKDRLTPGKKGAKGAGRCCQEKTVVSITDKETKGRNCGVPHTTASRHPGSDIACGNCQEGKRNGAEDPTTMNGEGKGLEDKSPVDPGAVKKDETPRRLPCRLLTQGRGMGKVLMVQKGKSPKYREESAMEGGGSIRTPATCSQGGSLIVPTSRKG